MSEGNELDSRPVMVVGAGLSGLVAAYRLRHAGRRVLVAEAAGRLGGRLMNQQVAGAVVDGGGAWVGPTQPRVLALLRELGLETVPTFDRGRHLLRLNGQVPGRNGRFVFGSKGVSRCLAASGRRAPPAGP
jgi:monoamine oxidase